jgi:hypothetical protein
VYLFSKQFLDEPQQRFTGPGRMRFVLQPAIAIVLGWRGGLVDARTNDPPFLMSRLLDSGRRSESLRAGIATIRNLISMGIVMDVLFQLILYGEVHAGAAVLVGPIFVGAPCALSRMSTARVVRWWRQGSAK